MDKKISKEDNTIITSDKYIGESGVQGGKIVGEHLVLGCFIIGIPLFSIGIFTFFYMLFISGFPENWPITLILLGPQSLAIVIGLVLIVSGYIIYKTKRTRSKI